MSEDTVEPLITECPSCHTRFRVTEAQLTAAGGRVRCGACKGVFRGADHLVLSLDAPRSSEDPDAALDALLNELSQVSNKHEPKRPEPTPVPRVVRDSPPEPPLAPPASAIGYEPRVTVRRDVPRRRQRRVSQPIVVLPPPPPFPVDATHANEIVEGRSEASLPPPIEPIARPEPAAPEPPPEPETSPEEMSQASLGLPEASPRVTEASPKVTEVSAERVEANASQTAPKPLPPPVHSPPKRSPEPPQVEEFVLEEHSSPAPFVSTDASRRAQTRAAIGPVGLGDLPFPLVERAVRRRRWWVFPAIFAALLALAGQVLWFQFSTWARDPEIRPLYGWLCAGLGCELPVMRALDAFRTKNLVVRAHPDRPGALTVDAIIVNDAPFAQPYPELELRFSAIGGNLVAARRFSPREYLAGDATGAKLIGAHTPVHIALEIEDPGADAVNYIVTFR